MKLALTFILLTCVLVATPSVLAQSATDAAEKADNLRLQLLDVEAKEAALKEWLQQLDEDLKPENIERSLAGIGSTHPEELREHRRRQLQIERDGVANQLLALATSRTSLESAIAAADAEAYQQSAKGASPAFVNQSLIGQFSVLPKWTALIVLTLLLALGITALVIVLRLQRSR